MGNEIFEGTSKEENPLKIIENLEMANKTLLRKNSHLEGDLEISENNLETEKAHSKALEKDLNDSQDALWKIREIIDKLKISSPGMYNLAVEDEKYIQQIFHATIKDITRKHWNPFNR